MTPSEKARAYAGDVSAGRIDVCQYVKHACNRFLRDLERTDWLYVFDEVKADRAVNFMQLLPHTKGKWSANKQRLILEPWQCFIECNLFGWVHSDTGLRRFRESYEEVPRKNGKALAIDTPVPTPEGWRRHGDLKPGDLVFGKDGQPVRVLAVSEQYAGPCHAISFPDCPPIIAHAAHEWVTERTWFTKRQRGSRGELPTVESAEIQATLTCGARGDFVHRIAVAGALRLPDLKLPIEPYTLGAWLGDGHSASQNITSADMEVITAIQADGYPVRQLVTAGQGKAKTYSMWNGDRRFSSNATSLKSSLRRVGVLHNKHIPAIYLRASHSQRMGLLRGLLDTDGHITPRGQIQFSNINKRLIDGVCELVRTLGMKPTVRSGRATIDGRDVGEKWSVEFFAATEEHLFNIARKRDRQRFLGKGKRRCRARTIISAEKCGEMVVNCIEVEGSLYLAGEGLVVTHNSARLAARGLYLLCADGESGAEIYSGATSEKQAHEVFKPAWMMVHKTPALQERYGIDLAGNPKNPGPIYVMEDMSKFEPMIGKPGDGPSPHGALIDEYHEHDSDHMVDSMQTGMGAREQPLLSIITTAGTNLGGPCYEKRRDVIRILEGSAEDETIFGIIYGLDPSDAWDSPDSLKKANPNYDVSVFGEFLLAQLAQARRSATKQNAFRTKHLNEWVGAKTAWMNMLAWQRQKRTLNIEDFAGVPCRMAVDLSSRKDVTAVNLTFLRDGMYYGFWKFFAPESAVEQNDKYREFVTSGHLEVTDGSMIDQEVIEDYLVEQNKMFKIIDVTFDEWQADYLMVRVTEKGIKPIRFSFNVRHVSEPMKQLEALILDGKYFHDGNPMMTWMMGNVAAKMDKRDNIYPNKDRPNDDRCKIDGVAVALMSMARWLIDKPADPKYDIFFIG